MSVHGRVWIRDYDLGVLTMLGAVASTRPARGGGTVPFYGVSVSGVDAPPGYGGLVPILWAEADAAYQPDVLPSITIRRNDPSPDMTGKSWWGGTILPAEGSSVVTLPDGRSGPDRVEIQPRAEMFKIGYEVIVADRLESGMQLLLRMVMGVIRYPGFSLTVLDDLGEDRGYDASGVGFTRMTELADIHQRFSAYSATFEIEAELDVRPTEEADTLTSDVQFAYTGD